MVTKNLKIGKYFFNFVFRHRYEKEDHISKVIWDKAEWKISLWYKKTQTRKGLSKDFYNDYMFGLEFLIIKALIKIEKH